MLRGFSLGPGRIQPGIGQAVDAGLQFLGLAVMGIQMPQCLPIAYQQVVAGVVAATLGQCGQVVGRRQFTRR